MKTIRYGIVGTSWIVRSMIDGAAQHEELMLTAVYSRSEENGKTFAANYGAPPVFTDLKTMAESGLLDMVYIASPNSCHVEQSRLFLRHGIAVLCEKPLSADPAAVEELQQLAQSKNLLYREAIMMLYQPQLKILRQAVSACGHISMAHFDFCQLSSKYEDYCRGELPNIFNPAMEAGTWMDLGIYCLYPALYLFGEPLGVYAGASFLTTGSDAACTVVMRYPDKQVVLTCSKTGQAAAPSEIIGDAASVTIGSISKLENIHLHPVGQPEQILHGTEEKAILMGREIAAFSRQLEQPSTADEEADRLARRVSYWMREVRRCAGISFLSDR